MSPHTLLPPFTRTTAPPSRVEPQHPAQASTPPKTNTHLCSNPTPSLPAHPPLHTSPQHYYERRNYVRIATSVLLSVVSGRSLGRPSALTPKLVEHLAKVWHRPRRPLTGVLAASASSSPSSASSPLPGGSGRGCGADGRGGVETNARAVPPPPLLAEGSVAVALVSKRSCEYVYLERDGRPRGCRILLSAGRGSFRRQLVLGLLGLPNHFCACFLGFVSGLSDLLSLSLCLSLGQQYSETLRAPRCCSWHSHSSIRFWMARVGFFPRSRSWSPAEVTVEAKLVTAVVASVDDVVLAHNSSRLRARIHFGGSLSFDVRQCVPESDQPAPTGPQTEPRSPATFLSASVPRPRIVRVGTWRPCRCDRGRTRPA